MSLEMKLKCERCAASTEQNQIAYICSYECTFCESCASNMKHICPNCTGELVQRPKRQKK